VNFGDRVTEHDYSDSIHTVHRGRHDSPLVGVLRRHIRVGYPGGGYVVSTRTNSA